MSKQPKVNSPISVPAEIFGQNLLEQVHFFCETFNIPRYVVLEHLLSQAMAQYVPTDQDVHNKLRQFIDDDMNRRRDKWFADAEVTRLLWTGTKSVRLEQN